MNHFHSPVPESDQSASSLPEDVRKWMFCIIDHLIYATESGDAGSDHTRILLWKFSLPGALQRFVKNITTATQPYVKDLKRAEFHKFRLSSSMPKPELFTISNLEFAPLRNLLNEIGFADNVPNTYPAPSQELIDQVKNFETVVFKDDEQTKMFAAHVICQTLHDRITTDNFPNRGAKRAKVNHLEMQRYQHTNVQNLSDESCFPAAYGDFFVQCSESVFPVPVVKLRAHSCQDQGATKMPVSSKKRKLSRSSPNSVVKTSKKNNCKTNVASMMTPDTSAESPPVTPGSPYCLPDIHPACITDCDQVWSRSPISLHAGRGQDLEGAARSKFLREDRSPRSSMHIPIKIHQRSVSPVHPRADERSYGIQVLAQSENSVSAMQDYVQPENLVSASQVAIHPDFVQPNLYTRRKIAELSHMARLPYQPDSSFQCPSDNSRIRYDVLQRSRQHAFEHNVAHMSVPQVFQPSASPNQNTSIGQFAPIECPIGQVRRKKEHRAPPAEKHREQARGGFCLVTATGVSVLLFSTCLTSYASALFLDLL